MGFGVGTVFIRVKISSSRIIQVLQKGQLIFRLKKGEE